jgi:hypothetical protein
VWGTDSMIRVLSAAVCTVSESIALAGIKAMAFIRNLIGVVEEICDHPHEFAATVNAFLAEHFPASAAIRHRCRRKQPDQTNKRKGVLIMDQQCPNVMRTKSIGYGKRVEFGC